MTAERRERRSHFRGKPRPGRRVEVSYTVVVRNTDTASGADDQGGVASGATRSLSEPFAPEPRRAYTRNIGIGGAFVVTDMPPEPGTPLVISIHVPTASAPAPIRRGWASSSAPSASRRCCS
jgi:hypothetical protein